MSKRIVFVDVETSGLDPHFHEPIEVGMVTDDPDAGYMEVQFSLDFDQERASPEALDVNGFGQRQFADQLDHDTAGEIVMRWFGWEKVQEPDSENVHVWIKQNTVVFVAQHVAFDAGFIAAWLRRQNLPVPWGKHAWDLPSLVAGSLGLAPPVSTTDMVRHFGLEPMRHGSEEFHGALDDARWNRAIYRELKLWEGGS